MATKTLYLLNTAAASPNYFGRMQDGGTAPAAAASAFGWTIGKTSTGYWRARLGASALATTTSTTSYIASAAGPTPGTGSTNTTAGDSFVSPTPYDGSFAAGNWTLSFGMRAGTATSYGNIRLRIWASVNASGASARELTSGPLAGSTVTMSTTTTTYVSSITWNAPAITLNNEYLFFQVEWQNATVGSATGSSVVFYQSAATVTTTNWAPIDELAGDLAPTVTFSGLMDGSQYGAGAYGAGMYSKAALAGNTWDLAGNVAPSVAFSASAGLIEAVAGQIAPTVSFAATAGAVRGIAGGVAPTVAFGANLDVYLQALSGALAPTVAFSATLDFAGQVTFGTADLAPLVALSAKLTAIEVLAGGVAPTVAFAGSQLTLVSDLAGDLAPTVAFAGAALTSVEQLAGGIVPQVAFGAHLGTPVDLAGDLSLAVAVAGGALTSGPLWGQAAPCPPPMWFEDDLCPDPGWIPLTNPSGLVYQGSSWGLGGYGAGRYGIGGYVPAAPSPWVPAELCNG